MQVKWRQLERFVGAARISARGYVAYIIFQQLKTELMISGANKKRTSDSLAPPLPSRAARRQRCFSAGARFLRSAVKALLCHVLF